MHFTFSRNSALRSHFRSGCSALLLFACFGSTVFTAPAQAATTTTLPRLPMHLKPAPDGQRFLFVVDISSGTKSLDAANRQALFDLIFTGLEGQMRTGDSFGLWLFNDELHAGQFPMQVWVATNTLASASLAAKYLREQKYSGRSRPDVVMKRLLSLIKSVRDLNVIFVSNGEKSLEGTPFDTNIAGVYERRKADRNKEQKPFVTLLVAHGGAIVSGAVVLAGEYMALPERPLPALASAVGTNRVSTVTSAVAAHPAAAPKVEIGEPQTTVSLNPQPAPPQKKKVIQFVTKTNSALPANSVAATASLPASTQIAGAVTTQSEARPPAPAPVPVAPLPSLFSDPMPVVAREPALPPDAVPLAAMTPASASASPVAAPAVVMLPAGTSAGLLLTIGGGLLAGCLALLFLVVRRARHERNGSFITQSMSRS